MRLGVSLGYFSNGDQIREAVALARGAEDLGFDCAWVAEAYGSDAPTVLAAIASHTTGIDIGSAVMQIPARTPAMTAMTAATLDGMSDGRFRLGLGVSGPQVSEGWHGVRYADPVGRTEEYVAIVRQAIARRRVQFAGDHFTLPLPDGPGKTLMLGMSPHRRSLPVYLAAVGPKNLALTGRIADGWHAIFFDPAGGAAQVAVVRDAATAAGRDPAAVDIAATVAAAVGPDPATAADAVRPNAALYIGGMGSPTTNFYHGIASAMGYREAADEVQQLFLSRRYDEAAAAVPLEFLTRTSLLGTADDMATALIRLRDAGITSVNVAPYARSTHDRLTILKAVAHARELIR
ncbi:LLM class F420-dependent oxidoreductase [Nakamurella deserti]|uniref:LLM class F420-dependent oxidoreductase n=1 Tax=Nakamurella deserti TaxID=2164074 RepID=UPI000DBE5402|nr:LLM class F420-dependent oxidoreductase [Nakamurella deserti]